MITVFQNLNALIQSDTLYFVPVFANIYGLAKDRMCGFSWIKYSSTMSSLVSVLYKQNLYLLLTAVSFRGLWGKEYLPRCTDKD